jgi:D-serine deaminase-like pyridoxal phosphate-dependent protein
MRHPAWGSSTPTNRRQRGLAAVRRIAATLDCPVETLMQAAHLEAYPDDTAELVRLWFKIKDPAARSAVLAEVRRAAKA